LEGVICSRSSWKTVVAVELVRAGEVIGQQLAHPSGQLEDVFDHRIALGIGLRCPERQERRFVRAVCVTIGPVRDVVA
jgi:hypothetical protein